MDHYRYKQPIILVEYGAFGSDVRALHDLIRALPNGKGIGTFIFGGEGLVIDFGRKTQEDPLDVYRQIARDYSSGKNISIENIGQRSAPDIKSLAPVKGKDMDIDMQGPREKGMNLARINVTFAEKSIEDALSLAKLAKNDGHKIMIVVHYSDRVTSLNQQSPPAEWKDRLKGDLEATMFQHTRKVITEFEKQGTPPDLIQIGNEINNGILLPKGVVDPEGDFGGLVRVASAGAREASPDTNILLSMASAGDIKKSLEFLRVATITDIKFDAIAMSYDPVRDGSIDNLEQTLNAITRQYSLPILVVNNDANTLDRLRPLVDSLPNGLGLGTIISKSVRDN